MRLGLRDLNTEVIAPALPSAVAFLERARVRSDGAVLIHCNEGKSRSCTIAAAYLVLSHGLSPQQAIGLVAAARRQP